MQVNNYTIYYTWIFLGYEKTPTYYCIRFISSGCFWLIGGWRGNCWLKNPGRWLHRPWAHDGSTETVDLLMIFSAWVRRTTAIDFETTDFQGFYCIRSKTHCFVLGGRGVFKAHDSRTLPCIWHLFVTSCFSGDEDEDSKLCASLCSKEEVAEVSNCTSLSVEFLGVVIKGGSVVSHYDKEKRKMFDL